LTLAWADEVERKRIIVLSMLEGRQTMNLRTGKGAELVVLRWLDGRLVGWTGVDVKTDPARPELFSQFVYPQYRGIGLGGLLEHFWWAYLDSQGYSTGFMRMELDSNQTLVEHRLHSGYYRRATREELGQKFITACRNCELYGKACHQQIFLAVDVKSALTTRRRAGGPLYVTSLPLRISVEPRTEPGPP
jgi:GNAT superfamily N-acetyltransferase